jgi:hypothetical protein
MSICPPTSDFQNVGGYGGSGFNGGFAGKGFDNLGDGNNGQSA